MNRKCLLIWKWNIHFLFHRFVRRGFFECSIESIPEKKRKKINLSRNSKYYMKKLLPDTSGIAVDSQVIWSCNSTAWKINFYRSETESILRMFFFFFFPTFAASDFELWALLYFLHSVKASLKNCSFGHNIRISALEIWSSECYGIGIIAFTIFFLMFCWKVEYFM